jgi:hypothetical protein
MCFLDLAIDALDFFDPQPKMKGNELKTQPKAKI